MRPTFSSIRWPILPSFRRTAARPASAFFFILIAAALLPSSVRASEDQLFRRANSAYEEGKFEESIRLYQELASARNVSHPELFYNMGNAYYRTGRFGPAIYCYEKALKLDPGLSDAEYNLKVARSQAQAQVKDKLMGAVRDPIWERAVTAFKPDTLTILFLLFWYLSAALAISLFYLGRNVWRVLAITALSLLSVVALASGLMLFYRAHLDKTRSHGIVLPAAAKVLEGPRENAAKAFMVHAGLKVHIMESDMEWYRIRLSNGDEGWIKRSLVGRL